MGTTANKRRAKKIEQVILGLYDKEDIQASIIDALVDLRHLCDVRELAFHGAGRTAYQHYTEEKR